MNAALRTIAALFIVLLASCAASRSPFVPSGPTTVGMPAALSDRERLFIPEIDTALRREGLVPVKSGRGDLQLTFNMAAGPIHVDTDIALNEGNAVLFSAHGRAAGLPLIGRSSVAQKSFTAAFEEFDTNLTRAANQRGWNRLGQNSSPADQSNSSPGGQESLPVY
jgi:hypothetical protein